MSLSAEEKNIVTSTWSLVKKDLGGNGVDLIIKFFEQNPTYQSYFKGLEDVPMDQLKGNKKFRAHATNVMYAVTMLVDNLEDVGVLVEMLEKLARNHRRRKITPQMFDNLGNVIIELLVEKLGSDLMNAKGVSAWSKTYGVILSVVKPLLGVVSDDD